MIPTHEDGILTTLGGFGVGHSTMTKQYRCNICGGQLTTRDIDGLRLVRCYKNNCPPDFIRADALKRQAGQAQEVIDGLPPELQSLYREEEQEEDNTGLICKACSCSRENNVHAFELAFPGVCPYCNEKHLLFYIREKNDAN